MGVNTCPAILIAAPASGQGKTTVSSALARLHTRQGRSVRVSKCGPDFLDQYWLTLASGAPVCQLDLWMTGEAVRQQGTSHTSYFHAWFPSRTEAVVALFTPLPIPILGASL